jgi:hypothetical protein
MIKLSDESIEYYGKDMIIVSWIVKRQIILNVIDL